MPDPIRIVKGRAAVHVFGPQNHSFDKLMRTTSCYDWNDELKRWEYPFDATALEGLFATLSAASVPFTVDQKISDWYVNALRMTKKVLDTLEDKNPTLLVPTGDCLGKGFEMYKFQKVGVNWAATAGRGIIGDSMGLGKTNQAIKTVAELEARQRISGEGAYLIIVPNSKLEDWAEEIRLWYGDKLPIHVIDHRKTSRRCLDEPVLRGWYITNWEKVSILLNQMGKHRWDVIIGDESHRMKGRDSKRAKAMFHLSKYSSKHRYLLTGTSIVNDVPDLWSQLHFCNPARFTSFWKFVGRYMEVENSLWGKGFEIGPALKDREEELHTVLKTNMIARYDDDPDVDVELPAIRHQKIVVELGPKQRKVYNQMRDDFVAWIGDEAANPDGDIVAPSAMSRVGRLKQIAGSLGIFKIQGIADSAKIDRLIEVLEDKPYEKFVILSQYKTMVDETCRRLRESGIPYGRMDGEHQHSWRIGQDDEGIKYANRKELMDAFQRPPEDDVNDGQSMLRCFVATVQTGGEGVTLTAARYLAFLDLEWTPKSRLQAFKRIHRIGQDRKCYILYFLARDTVDFSAILPTNRRKEGIINAVLRPMNPDEFDLD